MRPLPADLLPWALSLVADDSGRSQPVLAAVAGDAGNRRYCRLTLGQRSFILVDAPPATENNAAFLAVRELLRAAQVRVPHLYGADLQRGYLVLEDLGSRLLLAELAADTADAWYRRARAITQRMAALPPAALHLPAYDQTLLHEELQRFPDWFVCRLLACPLQAPERNMLRALFQRLVDSALQQPRVLVHRDFHSRNLMVQEDGQLALIDFQDAVVGPITYDPVSLLRDCYIRWPEQRVRGWALDCRDALRAQGSLPEVDDALFLRWFDWMGLQRHIKVLGTFARLYLRDGKSAYLDDLPLVIHYVLEITQHYAAQEPVFADFNAWFSARLSPLIAQQPWSRQS